MGAGGGERREEEDRGGLSRLRYEKRAVEVLGKELELERFLLRWTTNLLSRHVSSHDKVNMPRRSFV